MFVELGKQSVLTHCHSWELHARILTRYEDWELKSLTSPRQPCTGSAASGMQDALGNTLGALTLDYLENKPLCLSP